MKIAVDARELAGHATGVGRYLSELLQRWSSDQSARRHEWRLFSHRAVSVPEAYARTLTILPGSGGSRWEQGTFNRALRRDRPDVVFAPGYTAPLTAPSPIALTVHDVSFAAHPEWFSFREGLRRRTLTAWSARRARIVLTDSQFSRDEIVRHIGIPADRVRVIPLGLTRRTATASRALREPIVLFVGSIFTRRHVGALVEAFVTHVAPRVPGSRLEIVGDNRLFPQADPAPALRQCPPEIARRVTLRSYVDEETLRSLYARASVFVFLSEYEGFGFTPLEALAEGVPPVVLDTPVAREVYGRAARYVAAWHPVHLVGNAIVEQLTDTMARDAVLAEADAVLGRYDWQQTATATLRALEEAAGV